MSSETNQHSRVNKRITRQDVHILVTVFAVALAALALLITARNERRVKLEVDENMPPESAMTILERANEAAAFADTILSFLEGASVVVGAMLAVGAWMLRNSIQKQIDETNEFVHQTEARFAERERHLNEQEAALNARLNEILNLTRQEISTVHQQARDSFRVVSLLVLAEQQVRAHNLDTALRTLQAAFELDPDNQATNYLLGYLYSSRKQFDLAIERLRHALRREPDFAPAIAALGLALRRKGDALRRPDERNERDRLWAQAEMHLLDALDKDPRLTDADGESYYGTLGGLYRRQGRFDAAIHAYERAHKVTPGSSYPIVNLATLYQHQGQTDKARHYFERVLRIAAFKLDDDPRDVWARADYAEAKLVLGDLEGALTEVQALLEHGPSRALLETFSDSLRFLGESPVPVPGLDEMQRLLTDALAALDAPAPAESSAP